MVRDKVNALHEANPMLGFRGCRLGIQYPEITRMQARAIIQAALAAAAEGVSVEPEIMVPLVSTVEELKRQRALIAETIDGDLHRGRARSVPYTDRHDDRTAARRADRRRDRRRRRTSSPSARTT